MALLSRRQFLLSTGAAGLLAGCGRLPGPGSTPQSPARVPRIGLLAASSPDATAPSLEAFRQGLRALGRVDGQDVIIEPRYLNGPSDRLSDQAAELVDLQVEVILAVSTAGVLAAKEASTSV